MAHWGWTISFNKTTSSWWQAMELKVWVEGIQRIVCGVTENTTCQVGAQKCLLLLTWLESLHNRRLSWHSWCMCNVQWPIMVEYLDMLLAFEVLPKKEAWLLWCTCFLGEVEWFIHLISMCMLHVRLVNVNFDWQHNFNVLILCIIGPHVSKHYFQVP